MKRIVFLQLLITLAFLSCASEPESISTNHDATITKTENFNNTNSENKVTADPKDKPTWITKAFQTLESSSYPNIKAIAWWHENFDTSKLRIDSSPESLQAYQNGINSTTFIETLNFTSKKLDPPPTGKIYHGAYPDFGGTEDIVTTQKMTDFETLAGKNMAWAYLSNNWYTSNIVFPLTDATTVRNANKIPFIRLMPRTNFNEDQPDPNYTMQNIINGNFDTQLNQWAIDAKNFGTPLLLEFGTEVNGSWFPWNGKHNGGGDTNNYGDPTKADGPERFVDAYRHIIDIFRNNNVDNVTWFFHANSYSYPFNEAWNDMANYYPGDSYIDWLGVSIYGPQIPDQYYEENYYTLNQMLTDCYPWLTNLSSTKPIAILEFAITEAPENLSIEEF